MRIISNKVVKNNWGLCEQEEEKMERLGRLFIWIPASVPSGLRRNDGGKVLGLVLGGDLCFVVVRTPPPPFSTKPDDGAFFEEDAIGYLYIWDWVCVGWMKSIGVLTGGVRFWFDDWVRNFVTAWRPRSP